MHANGTFEVKLTPQLLDSGIGEEPSIGRYLVSKQFHGALEAVGKGTMLGAGNAENSAGYVLIELIDGILDGRKGTFLLQHNGIMSNKSQELNIVVIPDSGTGALKGMAGRMTITLKGEKHYYELDYDIS